MTIDRRSFILQGATLLAVTPGLSIFAPGPSAAQCAPTASYDTHHGYAQFKIAGWDRGETEIPNANDVWLTLNQSWRAAWR